MKELKYLEQPLVVNEGERLPAENVQQPRTFAASASSDQQLNEILTVVEQINQKVDLLLSLNGKGV